MLFDGKHCVELSNESYKQIIAGITDDESMEQILNNLYKAPAGVITSYKETEYAPDLGVKKSSAHMELFPETTFTKPVEAEIHGIQLAETSNVARHIGTFGYHNSYYFFNANDEENRLYYTTFNESKEHYEPESVSPKDVNPKEAVLWGYNMLKKDPYHFENKAFEGDIQFLGILPYDPDDDTSLMMSPKVNDDVLFKCFYEGRESDTYTIKWEWKEPTSSSWNELKKEEVSLDGFPELKANFSASVRSIMVRVTALDSNDMPVQVMTVGFDFTKDQHGTTANIKEKNYDLGKASGLVYWDRAKSLLVYGLSEDPTILFKSDTNDPSYFPYPHNTVFFDEPIVQVVPFLDDIIVFTTTKLHIVSLLQEETGMLSQTIQTGLNIKPWDVHLIRVVRNMVFFKSGNYYYMIVPRKGTPDDLTIAPISKNMGFFFDSFEDNVKEILGKLYDVKNDLNLIHYYNYLDFEDVHNVYVFQVGDKYLNVALLYNTVDRTWRIHTYESENIYLPFKEDATQKGVLMCGTPVNDALHMGVQFFTYSNVSVRDRYIPYKWSVDSFTVLAPSETPEDEGYWELNYSAFPSEEGLGPHQFLNYQYLDTGYREQNSDFKKRYREIQFRLNNIFQQQLRFYTEFILDGDVRKNMSKYKTTHNIDPKDPNYGLLTVERELIDPSITPGGTVLADNEDDIGCWTLDKSAFPEFALWKTRVKVSGKGYNPRLIVLSKNQFNYEIMNVSWVFRPLYAR